MKLFCSCLQLIFCYISQVNLLGSTFLGSCMLITNCLWSLYLKDSLAGYKYFYSYFLSLKIFSLGLPWWPCGKESAFQCRGRGFNPWGMIIPHATGQLSPSATTTELAFLNERAWVMQTTEPMRSGTRGP